ncbi:MAG: SDR family oxidoreductase [Rhodospirillaceae bacterium]|jgi:3-oxoacyl-[acyl-carrier protein] reductase|nr:SDR family oxidoreductase [Rhodospirillaceae bacterium]
MTGEHMTEQSRTIVVTGAASGIGARISLRLARPGDQLFIHTRANSDGLERIAETLRDQGCTVETGLWDLAETGAGRRLVEAVQAAFGGIDVMVQNAGYANRSPLGEATDAEFEAAHGAIARAFFEMSGASMDALKASPMGRVIAIGAFGPHVWRTNAPVFPATAAAKASLEATAKALALQLAPDGVTVNVVAPGFIEKEPGTHMALTPESIAQSHAVIPMGRHGTMEEVAAVVEFLASKDAGYVTGQVIHVNGGLV